MDGPHGDRDGQGVTACRRPDICTEGSVGMMYRILRPVSGQHQDLAMPDDTVAVVYGRAVSLDGERRETVEVWEWTTPADPRLLIAFVGVTDAGRYADLCAHIGPAATRGFHAHASAAPVPELTTITPELSMRISRQIHRQRRINRESPYTNQQLSGFEEIARRFIESGRFADIQAQLAAATAA